MLTAPLACVSVVCVCLGIFHSPRAPPACSVPIIVLQISCFLNVPFFSLAQQPSLSISQPEVSQIILSTLVSLNPFQTNVLVVYKSSDDAESSAPHILEDTADGSDDFEPDTSVALPPIPSMW